MICTDWHFTSVGDHGAEQVADTVTRLIRDRMSRSPAPHQKG